MIGALMDLRVAIVRVGVTGTDPLGKPITSEISRETDVPARLEQRGTEEGDAYVVNSWQGFLPPGTDVHERDQILHGGRTFEVEGTPSNQRVPGFPSADHVAVALKYVGVIA